MYLISYLEPVPKSPLSVIHRRTGAVIFVIVLVLVLVLKNKLYCFFEYEHEHEHDYDRNWDFGTGSKYYAVPANAHCKD